MTSVLWPRGSPVTPSGCSPAETVRGAMGKQAQPGQVLPFTDTPLSLRATGKKMRASTGRLFTKLSMKESTNLTHTPRSFNLGYQARGLSV